MSSGSHKNLERILQKKFSDFSPEPAGYIWENINNKIYPVPVYTKLWRQSKKIVKYAAIVLVATAIAISFIHINNTKDSSQEKKPISAIEKTSPSATVQQESNKLLPSPRLNKASQKVSETSQPLARQNNVKVPGKIAENKTDIRQKPLATKSIEAEGLRLSQNISNKRTTYPISILPGIVASQISYNIKTSPLLAQYPEITFTSKPKTSHFQGSSIHKFLEPGYDKHLSISAYYSFETLKYANSIKKPLDISAYSLMLSYYKSGFFVESGLAYSFSNYDGKSYISYESCDVIGSYEDVYLVTFDSTASGVVPNFHTRTIEISDTLFHKYSNTVSNDYKYLEIPVFIGFKKQLNNSFNYKISCGPIFSILHSKKSSEIELPEEYIRIINIEDNLPSRLKTSWQFMLAAGIGYNIGKHLEFSLEPFMKIHLKSYHDENYLNNNASSFGLRGGLIYNF